MLPPSRSIAIGTLLKRTVSETLFKRQRASSSIGALQAAFRDPSSPFHIPPGETGPESPDSPPSSAHLTTAAVADARPDLVEAAREKLLHRGLDPASFWEQRIVWGDLDSFQHVNNVRYVRFFESARIKWMTSLGEELGGPPTATAMLKGRGVSLILKSIEVQFRRPVTYPDILLIGYKPVLESISALSSDPATFQVAASAYSLSQEAFIAHAKESLVWYDYEKLKKCVPSEKAREILLGRCSP